MRNQPSPQPSPKGRGAGGEGENAVMQIVIDQFVRYRLLTFDRDPVTRGPTVEVAHEALLREWGRLPEWLEASRGDIRRRVAGRRPGRQLFITGHAAGSICGLGSK